MKKAFYVLFFLAAVLLFKPLYAEAGVLDELNYTDNGVNFYFYVNFSKITEFITARGIDLKTVDEIFLNDTDMDNETGRLMKGMNLKYSDMDECLIVLNTDRLESEKGFVAIITFRKKINELPADLKKKSVELKNGRAYVVGEEENTVFVKLGNSFVTGSREDIDSFLGKRNSGKKEISEISRNFTLKAAKSAMMMHLAVAGKFNNAMNSMMGSGALLPGDYKDNVFIQTLLSLDYIDWGMNLGDRVVFYTGLQGTKPEDSERLQMLCHTWIVGSSFLVTFSGMMAARSGDEKLNELTSDRKLMRWLNQAFGRIHAVKSGNGVNVTFEITQKETEVIISYMKKEIEKQQQKKIVRDEQNRISKLTGAVSENDIAAVSGYIKEKYNINGIDSDGNTPLTMAALKGNTVIARLLLENGALINGQNMNKMTPLHIAVREGKREMVTFLLGKGADVNIKGDSDRTSLHLSCILGDAELTRMLIVKGAKIDDVDLDGYTPLHYAAENGFLEVVKVLAEKNPDPDKIDVNGMRAIDLAAGYNHSDVVNFMKSRFRQEPKNGSLIDDTDEDDDQGMDGDEDTDFDDDILSE